MTQRTPKAAHNTAGWAATPRNGDASVVTELTNSGILTATTRANKPPRLWPITWTLPPVSPKACFIVSSRERVSRLGQSALNRSRSDPTRLESRPPCYPSIRKRGRQPPQSRPHEEHRTPNTPVTRAVAWFRPPAILRAKSAVVGVHSRVTPRSRSREGTTLMDPRPRNKDGSAMQEESDLSDRIQGPSGGTLSFALMRLVRNPAPSGLRLAMGRSRL
jgi:hypothetical protein